MSAWAHPSKDMIPMAAPLLLYYMNPGMAKKPIQYSSRKFAKVPNEQYQNS
jgi:hypothetical protein